MATARHRSGTLQSQFNPPPHLHSTYFEGAAKLQLSVHPNSANDYPNVLLNRDRWPGIQVGDVIELRALHMKEPCIFVVEQSDPTNLPPTLQVSVSKDVATCFGLSSGMEVTLTKVIPEAYAADAVEVFFSDQYLGRSDMWRMSSSLVHKCWHAGQRIQFVGCISATIKNIYVQKRKVKTAYVVPETKVVYRSTTAKCTIFIQLCREIWDFADDGERYYEKIVHSFLPALFQKWKQVGARHVITIVLISRVYYDHSEVDYAAGPIQRDDEGRNYKDFFKVVTDIEVLDDPRPTLNVMKEAFVVFQRDILLNHHYHQHQGGQDLAPRLLGRISHAHDGPILEAINLGLNPTESHYIDRSLSLTGSSTILITPGKGHFRVSKKLLKLTTTRLLDQGFGLDMIALGKAPLHATPLFSFLSADPSRYTKELSSDQYLDRYDDVLWGGPNEDPSPGTPGHSADGRKILYWQPFWISLMFWDIQMDLPFREDQYIPRARMPQFELMGLLHYDLISSISIPALDTSAFGLDATEGRDHFDQDLFSSTPTLVGSPNSPLENSLLLRNSLAKGSIANSLTVPIGKPSPLRRTPSTASLTVARPPKVTRIDSAEEEQQPRRQRPVSGQFDEASKERIPNIPLGTSPKTGRTGILQAQAHAERRARTASQSLSMSEASSSNLTRRQSGRAKSPGQSRRNTVTNEPARTRKNSTANSAVGTAPQAPPGDIPAPVSQTMTVRKSSEAPEKKQSGIIPFGKFTSSWLFTPWKLNNPNPEERVQTAQAPAQAGPSVKPIDISTPKKSSQDSAKKAPTSSTQPLAIQDTAKRQRQRNADEGNPAPGQRLSANHTSPLSNSPAETPNPGTSFRNSTGSGLMPQQLINPSASEVPVLETQIALARRWEHLYTLPTFENEIKWKSMESPACLPLTTGYFPTNEELEKAYNMHFYEVTLGSEMTESFLVKRPVLEGQIAEEAWGLSIMRVMVALRLAQGFQFVLMSPEQAHHISGYGKRPVPKGPCDILRDVEAPVYLSMSDQIHRLQYDPTGPSIRVERFVRKAATVPPAIPYRCLIWPKRGRGYTECETHFKSPAMELYGWNRLDMLAFGYEKQFSESLRYWRTRFIVIPTEEKPEQRIPRGGKPLSDEEIRLLGMDKLSEHFTKARWLKSGESLDAYPPVKFVPTTLDPVACIMDETVISKLEEIHEAGPLRKRPNNTRTIESVANDLGALANLMRQPGGLAIRDNRWHTALYTDSFTGEEFVSWLLREFQDVSNREQGAEWGVALEKRRFLRHCRNYHGFIDGHYYYRLDSQYQAATTRPTLPYKFTARILRGGEEKSSSSGSGGGRSGSSPRGGRGESGSKDAETTNSSKKRRILSQSMIIDVDLQKKSSQAETAILHYDIIQNPETAFHFQLHWVGTSAKFIDDTIQSWSRAVERYGLRIVESYVDQVSYISGTNVFQSCYPIQFAVKPPPLPANAGVQPDYFEGCLMKRFQYVPDICSSAYYAGQAEVNYSYRSTEFANSQYVHKSGLAFVQVMEGIGFEWLTNRLATVRHVTAHGQASSSQERPNRIMDELNDFCQNKEELSKFWEESLAKLMAKMEVAGLVPVPGANT